MKILTIAPAVLILLTSSVAFSADTGSLKRKAQLYVGTGSCNNGEVNTYERHKGCGTKKIGYTIDDASAQPVGDFIKVYAGNDTVNNKIVSKNPDHLGGSSESIGYLSKKPIPGGTELFSGNEPCNNGTATISTKHLGCGTEPLGYTLPEN